MNIFRNLRIHIARRTLKRAQISSIGRMVLPSRVKAVNSRSVMSALLI